MTKNSGTWAKMANPELLVPAINYIAQDVHCRYAPPLLKRKKWNISTGGHTVIFWYALQKNNRAVQEANRETGIFKRWKCRWCILERITDKDGNNRFTVTDKQLSQGRNVGKSLHQNCYICHKYLTPEGDTEYNQTTFQCSDCKMPLCKKDRSDPDIGHNQSCMVEHIKTKCKVVGCFGSDRAYSKFPRENQVQLVSRRLTRNMRWRQWAWV